MKKGIFYICLSAFGFSLMMMCVRLADHLGDPLPAIQKAFFRNVVAVFLALSVFLRAARSQSFAGTGCRGLRDWTDLLLRALFGTIGLFTNFYAISHIPIGDAMALNKTAPFFTLLLSWILVGERMTIRQLLCVCGAFAGALFVVKPGIVGVAAGPGPALIGLSSGFCAGTAYAFLHRLGRRGVNSAFIILFFSGFSCLACVPFLIWDYHPMTGLQLLILCGAGASAALGQFGITWAYRCAEPRQIAVYDYSGILFTALLGFLVFGQIPDAGSFIGFTLIIAMAALVFRNGNG